MRGINYAPRHRKPGRIGTFTIHSPEDYRPKHRLGDPPPVEDAWDTGGSDEGFGCYE